LAQPLGIDGDLDTGAFLLEQHHGARVAAAPAAREGFRHLREREIAHAHGQAELAPERIGERHVLVGELEREGRRVVLAGQELVDQGIEREAAPDRALAHRLPQRERLDARLDAQGEGFRERTDERIARHVVDELGDRRGADRPDIGGLVAHRVEHGLVSVEHVLVPADPDRELAGRCARGAAAHRRVQHVRALPGKGGVQLLHEAGRIGGEVEIGGARLDAGDQSVGGERDRLHVGRLRQRGEDHVGHFCERARALRPDGAGSDMMARRLPGKVVDDEPIAGLLQVGGDRAAHGAQTDESHHHVVLGHAFTCRFGLRFFPAIASG
jgi:hypothetical protein